MRSISVVIPTHKRQNVLKTAINSVLNQTVLPYEIIVVDDSSCSETEEIVNSFKSELLRYIPNKNGRGASSSRNLGVSLARGEFIAFLDDDDEFKFNKIEIIQDVIKDHPNIDIIYHKAEIFFIKEKVKYYSSPLDFSNSFDIYNKMLVQNYIGGTPMVVFKRNRFMELNMFDEGLPALEDYEMWLRASKNGLRFYFLDKVLTKCNYTTGKASVSKNIKTNLKALEMIEEKYKDDYKLLDYGQLRMHESWKRRIIIHKHLLSNNLIFALKTQLDLIRSQPTLMNLLTFFIMLLGPKMIFRLRALGAKG